MNQPLRLTAAGILDAMAKKIEIEHYNLTDPGLAAAHVLADYTYSFLCTCDKSTRDSICMCVPITGVISGLSRGRNQSNLGHGIYEEVRKHFTKESAAALHGELVAIGLFLQLAYDGSPDQIAELKMFMQNLGMPLNLTQAGIPDTPLNRHKLYEAMVDSPYFVDNEANRARLRDVMEVVWN